MDNTFQTAIDYLLRIFQQELALSAQNNIFSGNFSKSSISKIALKIIDYAHSLNASDIHIEPEDNASRLRLRIDGRLQTCYTFPPNIHTYLISYLKIQGKLDISEKRLPQDGAILLPEMELDVRISIIPVVWGEKAVLRLLAKGNKLWTIKDVGFTPTLYHNYLQLLERASGIIIITGPVNSGKSTLLYATLDYLNKNHRNIITIEDPVEIKLSGISQMQVNPKAGLTYALGLRAMLRQDPDVLMLGEIRDAEVAQAAFRAALTGHLVLTTLHTKNALGVIPRLLNMGVDKSLLALALQGATAQRLVRRLCPHCRQIISPDKYLDNEPFHNLLTNFSSPLYTHQGCPHCHFTGFKGRIPLYEILTMDKYLAKSILNAQGDLALEQQLNYESMWIDAKKKLAEGLTTIEEVWRALNGIEFS